MNYFTIGEIQIPIKSARIDRFGGKSNFTSSETPELNEFYKIGDNKIKINILDKEFDFHISKMELIKFGTFSDYLHNVYYIEGRLLFD